MVISITAKKGIKVAFHHPQIIVKYMRMYIGRILNDMYEEHTFSNLGDEEKTRNQENIRKSIKRNIPEFCFSCLPKIRKIQQIIDTIDCDKKIVIFGDNIHTRYLLKCIDFQNKKNLEIIGESYQKISDLEIFGLLFNKSKVKNADVIIISSYIYQKRCYEKALQLNPSAELITLYDDYDYYPFYTTIKSGQNDYSEMSLSELNDELENLLTQIENISDFNIAYVTQLKKDNLNNKSICKSIDKLPLMFSDIEKEFGIVIQGPIEYKDNYTYETIKLYQKLFPKASIILSTWESEKRNAGFSDFFNLNVEIVLSSEPEIINKASLTFINYQLKSTSAGLLKAKELGLKFAVRTRSDMRITSPFFIGMMKQYLDYYPIAQEKSTQVMRIICLPHLSGYAEIRDQFMCGMTDDLLNYYAYPIDIHINQNPEKELFNRYCSKYLLNNLTEYLDGIELTEDRCIDLLSRYFIIIDGNQFGIFWSKYDHGLLSNNLLKSECGSYSEINYIDWYKLLDSSSKT